MTVDLLTVQLVSALVILVCGSLFIVQAWVYGGADADRYWSFGFVGAITTTFSYLAAAIDESLWWANAVGNASFVFGLGCLWSGARAYLHRRPLLGVVAVSAAPVFGAVLLAGHDGGPWAGAVLLFVGASGWTALTAREVLRPSLRRMPGSLPFAGVCTAAAVFYALRTLFFVADGPDSGRFSTYFGTGPATLAVMILVLVAAFSMIAMRVGVGAGTAQFDPALGIRTAKSFECRADGLLGASAPVSLVLIRLEDLEAIADVYGTDAALSARLVAARTANGLAPAAAEVGVTGIPDADYVVLLPGVDVVGALAWTHDYRRALVAAPIEVDGEELRCTTCAGIAWSEEPVGSLESLTATARRALGTVLANDGAGIAAQEHAVASRDPGRS